MQFFLLRSVDKMSLSAEKASAILAGNHTTSRITSRTSSPHARTEPHRIQNQKDSFAKLLLKLFCR